MPVRALGGMTAWTREPSGSRASSTGCSSVISRPTHWATLWIAGQQGVFAGKAGVGVDQLAAALDVDVVVAVDHDLADRLVVQNGSIGSRK